MKNLYHQDAFNEIKERLEKLNKENTALWGKMNAAQMLAHCKEAFKIPLSDQPYPRMLMGYLFGKIAKKQVTSDTPYKQSLPTAPNFIIKGDRDFDKEKKQLEEMIHEFYLKGPEETGKHPHPFFGSMTQKEWGESMYKHLDHHFNQFGV